MKKIFAFFLALVLGYLPSMQVIAAYGNLVPPPGWSQGMGAAAVNTFRFASAATETTLLLGRIGAQAALTVGSQRLAVATTVKLAPEAAAVAARWAFANPLVLTGTAAYLAYQWYQASGFEVVNGQWVKKDSGVCTSAPCSEYRINENGYDSGWRTSISAAGSAWAELWNAKNSCSGVLTGFDRTTFNYSGSSGLLVSFSGTTFTCGTSHSFAATGSKYASQRTVEPKPPSVLPVSLPEFEETMRPKPVPDNVPKQLPNVDWPVELPVINPDPADKTKSKPVWMPTGDPVKQPNPTPTTTPDTWKQPGVRVTPSPTVENPWRVDIQPTEITKPNATPTPAGEFPADPATPGGSVPQGDIITCGLPGTPPCKIDESGTPEKVTKEEYKPELEDYKTKQGELKDKVSGRGDKSMLDGWQSVFVTPPMASCSPFVLPRDMGSIDPCPVVDGMRSVMAYIYALGGLWLCLGMVKKVI